MSAGPLTPNASMADRLLFLQRRHMLTVWRSGWRFDFFLFIPDAEEYQPPIWKSYREYLRREPPTPEVFNRPALWRALARGLVHTSSPISQRWKPTSLFFHWGDTLVTEVWEMTCSPGQDPQERAACDPLQGCWKICFFKKDAFDFDPSFLPSFLSFFLFLFSFAQLVSQGKCVEFCELCSWPMSHGYKIIGHLPQAN